MGIFPPFFVNKIKNICYTKEGYENLLERQLAAEEKIDELEQQLGLTMEGIEAILVHLGCVNETLSALSAQESMSVTQPFHGWVPVERE